MKKLSELGISPAPWSFTDDGMGECDIRCSGVPYGDDYEGDDIIAQSVQKKDASMFAAAPKLYEALLEMVEMYRDGGSYDYEQSVIAKAKAALAKASGESEVGK